MRDRETGNIKIADGEAAARLKGLGDGGIFAPIDIRLSTNGEIDGQGGAGSWVPGTGCGTQAARMVGMFVGDQNRV
jgi:hypothetical protein